MLFKRISITIFIFSQFKDTSVKRGNNEKLKFPAFVILISIELEKFTAKRKLKFLRGNTKINLVDHKIIREGK